MVTRSRSTTVGLAAVVSIAALGVGVPGQAQAGPRPPTTPPDRSVTLITGDRVTLRAGDPARSSIQRAPGRDRVAFSTYRRQDHLYVVPSDVHARIASGKLDRRLFDVTGLIENGYDDASSTALPLIVTYQGQAQQFAAAPGVKVTRRLAAVNGAALEASRDSKVLDSTGIDKIWLDGKRKVTLDRSVPQIGAPTAWQAGYTGQGVAVAVLDTGIDTSHPDLATQVAGSKNFTDSPDGDHFGHGTHVASTIAGTAAASNGTYKGVAPGARLYDGKVCDDYGDCRDSAVLAGMEWAAKELGARVVNLSLGGPDTPDIDPLEDAVNRLTAETGTLFVVAAGNEGPRERTIRSPGSADAALTVGAVDKEDQLAEFSSRGPRIGDGAVKPDISAPGVSIVAAKAKDAIIGDPVGDDYLSLDGTSMATPHVAGSAAILAQQHPDWKAAELKGALMASAKPAAGQTAFQQGAGRVDVAKGITQTVIAEPGNLSFGTASWPHDDDAPVTKPLTYRNLGNQPVTLHLTTELLRPDGTPAPEGSLTASAPTVTVPAGGTAAVQVTSNTRHDGPDGLYSGRIIATADDVAVTTAIGVEREVESHTLTVKAIGPDGNPALFVGSLTGMDQDIHTFIDEPDDTATLRLPKGEYAVVDYQYLEQPDGVGSAYNLVQPSVQLTKDTTVVFDARTAKPVKVTVPQSGARAVLADVGFVRSSAAGQLRLGYDNLAADFTSIYSAQVGSAVLPPEQLSSYVSSQWVQPNADGTATDSPYIVGQANAFAGVFPTGFVRAVQPNEQATVRQTVNASGDWAHRWSLIGQATSHTSGWYAVIPYGPGPLTRTLYVDGSPSTWRTQIAEVVPGSGPRPQEVAQVHGAPKTYRPGASYEERYHAAAFSMAPIEAVRTSGYLLALLSGFTDADGNRGWVRTDSGSSRLLQGGKVIAEEPYFGAVEAFDLPAARTTYTLEATRSQSTSPYATRIDYRWTFGSAATTAETMLPLLGVRYRPVVDDHNLAERTPVTVLPVVVDPQPGGTLPKIRKLTVEVSGDDGKTWRDTTVALTGPGLYTATFRTPAGTKVSLRSKVVDDAGNVTEVTVIAGYALR